MGTFLTCAHGPLSALARVATILSRTPKRTCTSPQHGKSHRRSRGWPLRRHRNRHRNCTFEQMIPILRTKRGTLERARALAFSLLLPLSHTYSCGACLLSPVLSPVSCLHCLIPPTALFKSCRFLVCPLRYTCICSYARDGPRGFAPYSLSICFFASI